ncbi:MAG: ATP-dependent Clp protease ATP-binding subunit ClpA, partial [Parvibaculaceae bacterium]|nr:ATP-dependent Clp protease ATP-binding subunit ClpA [Parvibaculaceae bacterium]
IELTPAAAEWLAKEGYDEQMGARPLARVIQEHIKKPLADEVLFGRLVKGGVVQVVVTDEGTLGFEFPTPPAPRKRPSKGKGSAGPKDDGDGPSDGGGSVPKVPLLVD